MKTGPICAKIPPDGTGPSESSKLSYTFATATTPADKRRSGA
jgi:hypothetical protein